MLDIRAGGGSGHNNSNPAHPIRKRHPDWLKAQKVVHKLITSPSDISECEAEILELANSYFDDIKDNVIVLQHKEAEAIKIIPYKTRFHDGYVDKAITRLMLFRQRFLSLKYRPPIFKARSSFYTLTYDPKNLTSLYDYYITFGKNLSKLLNDIYHISWINLREEKRKLKEKLKEKKISLAEYKQQYNRLWSLKYYRDPRTKRIIRKKGYRYAIVVLELQKIGNVHAHILLIDCPYIPKEWLQQREKELGFGTEKIKELKGPIFDALNYSMKYFKKGLAVNPPKQKKIGLKVVKTELGAIRQWEYEEEKASETNKDGFYVCPICGYEFATKTDLQAHLNTRHETAFHAEVTLHKALLWALNLKQYRMSLSGLEFLSGGHIRLTRQTYWIYWGYTSRFNVPKLGIITDKNEIYRISKLLPRPPPA